MKNLIPFQNSTNQLQVEADVKRFGTNLFVQFSLQDPELKLSYPPGFQILGKQVHREDGLWKNTCFELFLKPAGGQLYYEFNFSLNPAWNLYRFDSYRTPQHPQPNHDFSLRMMKWDGRILTLDLSSHYPIIEFSAGLTAVLKEKSGLQHYMALAHMGAKADFHLAESFILQR